VKYVIPPKRGEPELPLFSFDLLDLLARVRAEISGLPLLQLEVWVQAQPTLACVEHNNTRAAIRLHSVLNHADTPEPVIAYILCHELLHLVIPPEELEGRSLMHPPSFWEAELRLVPDRSLFWGWLILELGQCLKTDVKRECTFVKSNWKRLMNTRRYTMDQVAQMQDAWGQSEAIGGPLL